MQQHRPHRAHGGDAGRQVAGRLVPNFGADVLIAQQHPVAVEAHLEGLRQSTKAFLALVRQAGPRAATARAR